MNQAKFSDAIGAQQVLTGTRFTLDFYNVPSTVFNSNKFALMCKGSELPDPTITMIDYTLGNFKLNQPDSRDAGFDWSVTVIETARAEIYPMLWDWHQLVIGSESGNATRGFDQAKAIMTVYNLFGEKAAIFDLWNVYPRIVPPVKPSTDGGSAVEYQVTFNVLRYKPRNTNFR